MKYQITTTKAFNKALKKCAKRGLNMRLIKDAMQLLANTGTLPESYHPHKLSGNYAGLWECHIEPDWLMIWEQDDNLLTLLFVRTGTHSDLF